MQCVFIPSSTCFYFLYVYMRVLAISRLSDERINFCLCLFNEQGDEDLTALAGTDLNSQTE